MRDVGTQKPCAIIDTVRLIGDGSEGKFDGRTLEEGGEENGDAPADDDDQKSVDNLGEGFVHFEQPEIETENRDLSQADGEKVDELIGEGHLEVGFDLLGGNILDVLSTAIGQCY